LSKFVKLTVKDTPPGEDPFEWINLDNVLSIYFDKDGGGTCMTVAGEGNSIGPYVEAPEVIAGLAG
jgi:hypothetical protein